MEELTPRQIEFLKNYNDPKSETFGNALQSALKAGYTQEYAESIMSKDLDWMAENVGRRKRLLDKAENNLEVLLDSEDERVKGDMTKFVAKTLGKDEGYTERQELTGKEGKDLIPDKDAQKLADEALKNYLNGNQPNPKIGDTETKTSPIPV